MFRKTLIALGLLAVTTLSGFVVYGPPRPVVYGPAPYYGPAVVVAPAPVVVAPVYGYWGWGGGYRGHWR